MVVVGVAVVGVAAVAVLEALVVGPEVGYEGGGGQLEGVVLVVGLACLGGCVCLQDLAGSLLDNA